MATPGSKPTHRLKLLHAPSQRTSEVGVGWLNEDGSISVVLQVGVTLDWRDKQDCVLTLFPIDRTKESR